MSSAVEAKDAECQTVLQCTPHLLRAGHKANVISDANVQTLVTANPNDLDEEIVAQLTYTDPNDINKNALREVDSTERKEYIRRLKWQLPNESIYGISPSNVSVSSAEPTAQSNNKLQDINAELLEAASTEQEPVTKEQEPATKEQEAVPEEYKSVPEEQEAVPKEPEPVSKEQASIPELRNNSVRYSDEMTASLHSISEELKGILREPEKPKRVSATCQTNLMVFPHVLSTTDNVMVTSELAAQTSVTCLPEGSLTDIIPKLKSYLVHDGKAVGTSGDSEENTSVLDLIQELIKEVENTHSHMFDPDYIPPSLSSDLKSKLDMSDNDYFLHILDNILTTATEPIEYHGDSDITSLDFQDTVDAMVNSVVDSDLKQGCGCGTGVGCACSSFGFKIKLLINNNSQKSPANAQQGTCFEFIITQAADSGKQNGSCTQLSTPGKEITMPLKAGEMKIECCDARPIQIIVKSEIEERDRRKMIDPGISGTSNEMDASPGAIVRELYETSSSVVKILPEPEDGSNCEYCSAGGKETRKSKVSFSEPLEKIGRCVCFEELDEEGLESCSPNICEAKRLNYEKPFRATSEEENMHKDESHVEAEDNDTKSEEIKMNVGGTAPVSDDDLGSCTSRSKSKVNIEKTQSLPITSSFCTPENSVVPDKISSSVPCMGLAKQNDVSTKETPLIESLSAKFSCTRCAALSLPEVWEPLTCARACQADSCSSLRVKADPVALALQACDEGFKPMKKAINEVHHKLMLLNLPELDYLYKKKTSDTEFTKKKIITSKLYLQANTNVFQAFTQRSQGTMHTRSELKTTKTQTNYDKSLSNRSYAGYSSCSCSSSPTSSSRSRRHGSDSSSSESTASSKSMRNCHKRESSRSSRTHSDESSDCSPSSRRTDYTYGCKQSASKETHRKKRRGKRKVDLDQASSASFIVSVRPDTAGTGQTVKIDRCILHSSKKQCKPHTKKLKFTGR